MNIVKWKNLSKLDLLQLFIVAMVVLSIPAKAAAFTIVCPPNKSVTAAQWECGVNLDWEQFNWYSTVTLVDTTFEPPQGTNLSIGPHILTITGVDINGNTSDCSFTYTVVDAGANSPMICKDNVQVILDENCQREITPQMMLEPPGPYGCPNFYTVLVLNPSGLSVGDIVDLSFAEKEWIVKVVYNPTSASCWGSINIRTDTLPPSIKCPADTVITCNVPVAPARTGNPLPGPCFQLEDLIVSHSDHTVNSFCDGDSIAFKITRTWMAVDTFSNVTTCKQYITGVRASVNDVVFPPDYNGIMHPFLICNDSQSYETMADTSVTGRPTLAGLPLNFYTLPCDFTLAFEDSVEQVCGAHYIIKRNWEVIDLCLSAEKHHTQTIEILDTQAPVFDVQDTLHISTLSPCVGEVTLPPIDFIYDCSPFSVEIWTPWDTIHGDGGILNLPLTPDTVAATYVVSDACGNEDVGITILEISPGVIANCPPDVTIGYDDYVNNYQAAVEQGNYEVLDPLGMPELYVNCEAALSQNVIVDVDTCGRGIMTRIFTVTTPGLSGMCEQEIKLVHVSDFVVEFPKDSTFYCGTLPLNSGEPIIHNADIEHIQISYTQQQFNTVPDACFKIQRTWKVVNTCVTGQDLDQEFSEVPESMLGLPFPACDLDGDGDCDNRTYRDSWNASLQPGLLQATQQFTPDTDPDLNPWDGVLQHAQVFKVVDTVDPYFVNGCSIPEYVIPSPDCEATITLPMPAIEECSNLTVLPRIKIDGVWKNGLGPHYGLEPGVYEVEYKAIDNCNNVGQCNTLLTVINPAPEANCKASTTVQLQLNTCSITVFASDFNDGSTDNCMNPLFFSFTPEIGDIALTFDECDIGIENIKLFVIDKYGQIDSCNAMLVIQEPSGGSCDCFASVHGFVRNETEHPVRFAKVAAVSTAGYSNSFTTDGTGMYFFDLNAGDDVTISASKDINPANGVTTFDGVLIAKHILNVQLLDSPYKIIAADVNGSGTVTTFDLVEMRKLILNITTEFPVPSWRLIPESFVFPDPTNPWAAPIDTAIYIPTVNQNYTGQNFIAIKIGDVNNSADPLNLTGPGIEERSASDTLVLTAVQSFLPGNRVKIDLYPENKEILTIQYALKYDPIKFVYDSLVPVFYADDPDFGWNGAKQGKVMTSWFSESTLPVSYNKDVPLYSLRLTRKSGVSLTDGILSLAPDVMPIEVMAGFNIKIGLKLVHQTNTSKPTLLELDAPVPNPFGNETRISGQMPGPGTAVLYIYDTSGRAIDQQRVFSETGLFNFVVGTETMASSGKYHYEVSTPYGSGHGVLIKQ